MPDLLGFGALRLAQRCNVPVATSSLMQIPMVEALLPPGKRAGVLTISAKTLTKDHLRLAGAREDTPVVGTDDGREFTRVIIGNEQTLDTAAAARDILAAGEALVRAHPEVGAIVHIHAWWRDPIPSTQVNYPCGTYELAAEVADLVRHAPDPSRAVIGLKNHGLTITGRSIPEIFARIDGMIVPQVPMA